MRRSAFLPVVALCLSLCLAAAALAAGPPPVPQSQQADPAKLREYVRLFGYREMLATGAAHQLAAIIEMSRQSRPDVAPAMFDLIEKELQAELNKALDQAGDELADVLSRHMTREDVDYLVEVGRDPRMQKVVAKQPLIADDLEGVGERMAMRVTQGAAPRIAERLRQLDEGQSL